MTTPADKDWNPRTYARFGGLRLRPALDLLAQVGDLPAGEVVDLGCGAGAVGPALAARFVGRRLIAVDLSPAMLAEAEALGCYDRLVEADLTAWAPETAPALIFSNAALNWVGDHEGLLRRLAGALAPGGMLAVQMPGQHDAPSHALIRDIAVELYPDRFDLSGWFPSVANPADYARMLAPLGQVNAWETTYLQRLDPSPGAHPVRRFIESTYMRPYLAKMDEGEAAAFVLAYEAALAEAYPVEDDGRVFFPFRRVFVTLST